MRFNWKKIIIVISCFLVFVSFLSQIRLFSPLKDWLHGSFKTSLNSISNTFNKYFYLIEIQSDNQRLLKENLLMKTKLNQFLEIKEENERLNKAVLFQKKSPFYLILAKIIGQNLFLNEKVMRLNKGKKDLLKKSMGVISEKGVVGYLSKISEKHSDLILLNDPLSSIDALVQRSRVRGVVRGNGISAYLKYVSKQADIQIGDLVVTSGYKSNFPKGFPIGKIVSIEKDYLDFELKIEIELFVKNQALEEVFIILSKKEND